MRNYSIAFATLGLLAASAGLFACRRAVLASEGSALRSTSSAEHVEPWSGDPKHPVAFVRVSRRDPRYFELSDGRPFIPIGLNLASLSAPSTEEGLARMEHWLKELSSNGGNFARVWLSSPFWDVEHQQCGQYDEMQARRIEALLQLARKYDVRLKLTLEHFREIDPQSPYAKRRAWATKPLHHVSRGGTARSIAEWFDGQASREQFRRKLSWYQRRFGDNPMVFGWELWNEVNAVRGGDYMEWTRAMLAELHRRFPHNLCMQSLGSFDRAEKVNVYRLMTLMKGNDVAQVHRYLDLAARLEVCHGPVDVLAADAVRRLASFGAKKPILLAESGAVEPGHSGPFRLYAKDKAGIILHDVIFAPFFAGAAGPGHCWHWDVYVDRNDLWWHFGRFAELVRGIDPAAEHFRPLMADHPRLRVYILKGTTVSLVWCRDKQTSWQTELAEGKPPELLAGQQVDLSPLGNLDGAAARVFDPWTGRWQPVVVGHRSVDLPAFRRSITLRIDHREHP